MKDIVLLLIDQRYRDSYGIEAIKELSAKVDNLEQKLSDK